MNSTLLILLLEYKTGEIPLKECCEKFFGLSYSKASSKARSHQLPVPCYRGGSQKSEWLISAASMAEWLDTIKAEALREFNLMNA